MHTRVCTCVSLCALVVYDNFCNTTYACCDSAGVCELCVMKEQENERYTKRRLYVSVFFVCRCEYEVRPNTTWHAYAVMCERALGEGRNK